MIGVRQFRGWCGVVLVALLAACGGDPEPIAFGSAECDYCRMEIADARYGSQLITSTGKTYEFDSIECLASFAATLDSARIRTILVSDFNHPGTMMPVRDARFHRDPARPGPMGGGLFAVPRTADSATMARLPGNPLSWDAISAVAAQGALQPGIRERAPGPGDET